MLSGLDFFITEIPDEVFTYTEEDPMNFAEPNTDIYPYLVGSLAPPPSELCPY